MIVTWPWGRCWFAKRQPLDFNHNGCRERIPRDSSEVIELSSDTAVVANGTQLRSSASVVGAVDRSRWCHRNLTDMNTRWPAHARYDHTFN